MSDETSTAVLETPAAIETPAAPSTPASEPAAPASPATPAVETSTAPSSEFKAPTRNAGEGVAAYLKRTREAREAHAAGKPTEAPKIEAAQPAAGEVKPIETAKPAEPAKAAAEADPSKEDELSPDVPVEIAKLSEALKADPAKFEQACTALGLTKDQTFAMARLSHKAGEFIKEFPGGLEDVKFTKQYAAEREQLEQGFTTIATPQNALDFIKQTVIPMSYVLGEDGQPVPDGRGGFQTDGTVERFMDNMVQLGVQLRPDHVFKQALSTEKGKELLLDEVSSLAAEGDDEMQAALEIIKDRLEKRGASSAVREPQTAKEKELATREAATKAEEDRLAQQRQAETEQRDTDNERAVATSISSEANKLIDQVLGKFAIPEFNKESAREKIRTALYERIDQDATFKMQAAQLARKQYGSKSHQERVGLALRTAKSYLWSVADPIIKAAGGELIAANKAKHDKITTQIDASKKEPRAGLTTPSGTPAQTKEQLAAQIRENLVKQGKEVSVANMLAERRRIQAGQ